jgi:hypothetical protein
MDICTVVTVLLITTLCSIVWAGCAVEIDDDLF